MFRFSMLLLSIILSSKAYKILVYSPQMSRSHVSFMGHLADTLAEAGHDVTVFLPGIYDHVNVTGVKLAKAIVSPRSFELQFDQEKTMQILWDTDSDSPALLLKMMRTFTEIFTPLCQAQLKDEKMMNRLRHENFDLGIAEVFDPCSLAFIEALGIEKHIAAFSTNIIETFAQPFGLDNNPSYVPAAFSRFSDEMSYLERLKNFAINAISLMLFRTIAKRDAEAVFHQYISADICLDDVLARSAFVFVNSEDFTEFPRPLNMKIVFVGGIGVQKPKKLSKDFQKIMDGAAAGAVFVSFGSIMKSSTMPKAMKESFVGAFRNFPEITFIWKYEIDDDIGSDVPNLIKTKWAPQNDLFGHPNMRAFISHGGMNSITESTHAGIPVVTIPLFGDQYRNSRMVAKRHVGVIVNKQNITAQSLTDAITAVIYDKRYWDYAKRLAKMIRKKPMSARERVVKYAEFAAEFGHIGNLDSASVKLNFFQYYLLDIIIPFTIVLLSIFLILICSITYLARKIFRAVKVKTE